MRTVWKFDGKYKADPELAYDEIQALESITPQSVVDLARDEGSVIHNDFEWDDEVAGEKFRLIQARDMIRSFVLVSEEPTHERSDEAIELCVPQKNHAGSLRALHNTSNSCEYAPVEYFIENKDEYQVLLDKAMVELESFKRRYSMLAELEEVFNAINNL